MFKSNELEQMNKVTEKVRETTFVLLQIQTEVLSRSYIAEINRIAEGQYYERKTAEGKHPLCVINAVKNKLVLRGAAIIKSQKPFVDNFVKLNEATKNVT